MALKESQPTRQRVARSPVRLSFTDRYLALSLSSYCKWITFGGLGCGCCCQCCPLCFYHSRLAWPSSISGSEVFLCKDHSALCTHTCMLPRGNPLKCSWWWRWQAHVVLSLWLLLAVHAPIIGSSTLPETDQSTAETHAHRHAKTALPASLNVARIHSVTWGKDKKEAETWSINYECFRPMSRQREIVSNFNKC